jgi:hypothetical protein
MEIPGQISAEIDTHQLAKRIAARTGLDMDAARRAAEIELTPANGRSLTADYTVSTPDVGEWRGRYFVMTVPTSSSLSNRGASTVTKNSARTRR